jgi:hypothetical protein
LAVEGNGLDRRSPRSIPEAAAPLKVTLPKAGTYEIYCPIEGTSATGGGTSTENMNTGTTEPTTTYSTGY